MNNFLNINCAGCAYEDGKFYTSAAMATLDDGTTVQAWKKTNKLWDMEAAALISEMANPNPNFAGKSWPSDGLILPDHVECGGQWKSEDGGILKGKAIEKASS